MTRLTEEQRRNRQEREQAFEDFLTNLRRFSGSGNGRNTYGLRNQRPPTENAPQTATESAPTAQAPSEDVDAFYRDNRNFSRQPPRLPPLTREEQARVNAPTRPPQRTAPATPAPTADYEERMQRGSLPAGRSAAPGPMGEYSERAAAGASSRRRPAQRQAPRPRYSEADIARIRSVMEGGDVQPEQPDFFERRGIRRTNETGEGAPSTGSFRGDIEALGRALGFKKGGMVKPKKYEEGGPVKVPGKKPAAGGPKAPASRMRDMISPEERRELDAPLTRQERDRMRESGFKKGGAVKPKVAMKKGGAVKAPAKKMAHGGKVHGPKKMMKGGMTSKPKKMMGGGRAMYAKGGMARGCK